MEKPTLICSVWMKKIFNLDSFHAQFKGIWKMKKKFEIRLVGQSLFLIIFLLQGRFKVYYGGVSLVLSLAVSFIGMSNDYVG